jgi:hypothetical protein
MMRRRQQGRGEKLRVLGAGFGLGAGARRCWFLGFCEGVSLKVGKGVEGGPRWWRIGGGSSSRKAAVWAMGDQGDARVLVQTTMGRRRVWGWGCWPRPVRHILQASVPSSTHEASTRTTLQIWGSTPLFKGDSTLFFSTL